ncbi:DUF397 domain-containing protein [Streptomyces sp. NPDC018031]|uniref:DUF397 domain-containing protein n=1 Tax=Streptomyces sp. NPDC018031 TaxID=3365033 RepID=UPI0037B2E29D
MSNIQWRKSSYSGATENNCVQVARVPGVALLRESDDPAHTITTSPAVLARFLRAAQTGGFDHLGRAGQ